MQRHDGFLKKYFVKFYYKMGEQKHCCSGQHHKYAIFLPLFNAYTPRTTFAKTPPSSPDSVANQPEKNRMTPGPPYKL
jgi:hypothetical protein